VGAGSFLSSPPQFDIGDQLYRTATHILTKNKFEIKGEHIKWQINRSALLNIESGEVKIRLTDGQEIKL
jgi:chemotaxis receptor (MCP) glutamine deamidase CheD